MRFVDLPTINENEDTSEVPVNPDHVVMLIKIPIPTGLTTRDGQTPIVKPGTGIVLSNGNVLPSKSSREEIRSILEEEPATSKLIKNAEED